MPNSESATNVQSPARERELSPRAKHRLRLAGALLRRTDLKPEVLGQGFYKRVMQVLDSLSEERRRSLRLLVDWVEAYELEEARAPSAMNLRRNSSSQQP